MTNPAFAAPQPLRGRVRKWFAEKGYGFLARDDREPDVFVHINDCAGPFTALTVGQRVAFDIEPDQRTGRHRAARVVLL